MTTVRQSLESHLQAAAATLAPQPAVRAGEPAIPGGLLIAYWFEGYHAWPIGSGANSMKFVQRSSRWGIRAYYPQSQTPTPDADSACEDWVVAATEAVERELWGHIGLDGAATGGESVLSRDAQAGWHKDANGADYRTVEWTLDALLSEVFTIAR